MPRIPVGEKYTVTVTGSKWKPVSCRYCGCEYVYQVKHTTSGSADNPLWLNKQGAINKAEERANEYLQTYLDKKVMHYSCPECGCYQPDAVVDMKNKIWIKGIGFGLITAFLVTVVSSILTVFDEIFITVAFIFGLASGAIVCLAILNKLINFNPNLGAASRRNQKFSENYPVVRKSEFDYLWNLTRF